MKDRDTNQVRTEVVQATDGPTLRGSVGRDVQTGAMAYTDEAPAYRGLPTLFYRHESVQHSVSEHVRDMVHTNGMESVWSLLKRGYIGVYCKISSRRLEWYVAEFSGRHNIRGTDTLAPDGQSGRERHGGQTPALPHADCRQRAGFSGGGHGTGPNPKE